MLVADDDAPSLLLAGEAMRLFSCGVVTAGTGADALRAVHGERFDVVFLDVHMPDMDGFAATAAIRAFEAQAGRPRTPVVALTASAMPQEQQACLAHGMDEVLVKPFRLAALEQVLRRWCPP